MLSWPKKQQHLWESVAFSRFAYRDIEDESGESAVEPHRLHFEEDEEEAAEPVEPAVEEQPPYRAPVVPELPAAIRPDQPYWAVGVPSTQQYRAREVVQARHAAEFAALEQRLHWAASPGLTPEMDAKLKSAATRARHRCARGSFPARLRAPSGRAAEKCGAWAG